MSKVKALYHVVFATKSRRSSIPAEHAEHLYRFIWREISDMKCRLIRIGGVQNHIHILLDLHPSVALSNLVQNIKSHSSVWLKTDGRFPLFNGWAAEYYACTISPELTDTVVEYIKKQPTHHDTTSLEKEIERLYRFANLPLHPGDLS